jgi:hypothetical protein
VNKPVNNIESFDVVIVGGTVVTPEGTRRADIGIRGETIAAVEPESQPEGSEEGCVSRRSNRSSWSH